MNYPAFERILYELLLEAELLYSDRRSGVSIVGALDPHRAKIGVFMTTSKFTEGAEEYVKSLNMYDVRLIDGVELVEMMIECGIGVKKLKNIELLEIDNQFFSNQQILSK